MAQLYQKQPEAALCEAEVEAALAAAGAGVNKVTVYRMLDRFAAAGLLLRRVDAARVTRFALAPLGGQGAKGAKKAVPRFECQGCQHQFRLLQGSARVQSALQHMLRALATAGHQSLAVEITVHGRCAGCAGPCQGPGA